MQEKDKNKRVSDLLGLMREIESVLKAACADESSEYHAVILRYSLRQAFEAAENLHKLAYFEAFGLLLPEEKI